MLKLTVLVIFALLVYGVFIESLVFITGDVVNFRKKFEAKEYLKKISSSGTKTYFVLGNWDYKVKDVNALKKDIERVGIKVLENETVEFTKTA